VVARQHNVVQWDERVAGNLTQDLSETLPHGA
jgi:hypothetical protein